MKDMNMNHLKLHEHFGVRTQHRSCVTLFGIDYASDFLNGVSRNIIVAYDPTNLDMVSCYTVGGDFLGEARRVQ